MQDALAQQGESDLWVVGRPGRVVFVVLKRLDSIWFGWAPMMIPGWPGGLPKMDDGILDEKKVEVSWFMGVPHGTSKSSIDSEDFPWNKPCSDKGIPSRKPPWISAGTRWYPVFSRSSASSAVCPSPSVRPCTPLWRRDGMVDGWTCHTRILGNPILKPQVARSWKECERVSVFAQHPNSRCWLILPLNIYYITRRWVGVFHSSRSFWHVCVHQAALNLAVEQGWKRQAKEIQCRLYCLITYKAREKST